MIRYNIRTGVKKIKTKAFVAVATLGLIAGGGGLSLAIFGSAHAITPPTWDVHAPTAVDFTCGGGLYPHTLLTASEDSSGNLTGTGRYDVDGSYTWSMTGNVSGATVNMSILYTGTAAGSVYNLSGTIASNGSVSGFADSNCQTFTMPASSFVQHCTPTGFIRDGIDLTARQIGGTVTSTLDATGCNIGLYIDSANPGGVSSGGNISGANYFGVVVNGTDANVEDASVHNIGEAPHNGSQHGVAIYYTEGASGLVNDNNVNDYQKGGVVVNGDGTTVNVTNNTVTGLGPVSFIAQNGIQMSRGANGIVRGNSISNNFYTGTVGVGPNAGGQNPPGWQYTSAGLLLYQPGNVNQSMNHFSGNQRNLAMVP